MGLSEDVTAKLAKASWGPGGERSLAEIAEGEGLGRPEGRLAIALQLAEELQGFPRHLATHVGGFVITRGPLVELAVVGNAAMDGRTVLEWDKDDIDALGILKVDVLGLGMLTCLRRALDLLRRHTAARPRPRQPAARLPRDLRDAPARRQPRRVPGREPGADEHAAAAPADVLLRPRRAGGDRPARPYPGRHGASLPAPKVGAGAGPLPEARARARAAGRTRTGAGQDARRAALPGAGDAASPSSPPASRRRRPTTCAARWRRSNTRKAFACTATGSSAAWWRAATTANSPSASSSRSRASASMVSRRAMPPPSPTSPTPRPG